MLQATKGEGCRYPNSNHVGLATRAAASARRSYPYSQLDRERFPAVGVRLPVRNALSVNGASDLFASVGVSGSIGAMIMFCYEVRHVLSLMTFKVNA